MTGTSRLGKMSRGIRFSAAEPASTMARTTTMTETGRRNAPRMMSIVFSRPLTGGGASLKRIDRGDAGLGQQVQLGLVEAGDGGKTTEPSLVRGLLGEQQIILGEQASFVVGPRDPQRV